MKTMQCKGGCSRHFAFLRFNWYPRIILGLICFSWVGDSIVGEMDLSLEVMIRFHEQPEPRPMIMIDFLFQYPRSCMVERLWTSLGCLC